MRAFARSAAPARLTGDVSLAAFVVISSQAIMLALAANKVLEDTQHGLAGTGPLRVLEEFTGTYSALLLMPAVVLLARRFPLRRSPRWRTIAVLVFGLIAYSLLHTALVAMARAHAFPALGFPAHSFAHAPVRQALIELSHDAIGYPAMVAVTMWWDARARLAGAAAREADLADELAHAQLHSLRLRLDPHFLFNTLSMIATTMHTNAETADEMLDLLAQFLRRGLERSDTQETSLADELESTELYLRLMQHRFGEALSVALDVSAEAPRMTLPAMTLQPLVENALRHGAIASVGRGEIRITARSTSEELVLEVWNDGPPLPADIRDGEGLSATKRRLALLYGERASLQIAGVAAGGVRARVIVPCQWAPS